MCPDRQIISLYVDGELPSPWKEKLEVHLESCPDCRGILINYNRLGDFFRGEDPGAEAAQERVWNKLRALNSAGQQFQNEPGSDLTGSGRRNTRRFWKRSITLPLPAAAAAAAVLVVVFFLALQGFGQRPHQPDSMAVISDSENLQMMMNLQEAIPVQDMDRILQFLSSQNNNDVVVIMLPENRRFYSSGEPALINAVDHSRRSSSR